VPPGATPTSAADELLDIGEVSARTGLAPSKLRFYEQRGLIEHEDRFGLRRQFPADVVHRISFILLAQEAGFTLDEIGELLDSRGKEWKKVAARKHQELRGRLTRLEHVLARLEHALECESPTLMQCQHEHHHVLHTIALQPRFGT
jgi:DNA-binding transcriptional MerR regulator